MERDAPPPSSAADAVPPYDPRFALMTGLVGVGLCAAAAALNAVAAGFGGSAPGVLNTVRLFLAFVGVVTAGAGVSLRPDLWRVWLFGAAAAGLGVLGLPANWDSFRLVFGVAASAAAAGAVLAAATPNTRAVAMTAWFAFNFSGIFLATTSPPATPWITTQVFNRVHNPYLQFMYLRNAYHYYSPEPGPASILAFLLKTETGTDADGKPVYQTRWVVMPKRPADVRDPLGLTYYRRLSITEQTARGDVGLVSPVEESEKREVLLNRRELRSVFPFHPAEPEVLQYKLPNPEVSRYVLPSYAAHVILENTPDKATAARTTVKIYRLEHRNIPGEMFARPLPKGGHQDPYHPVTYKPYFLGEFGFVPDPTDPEKRRVRAELLDPQEAMLYWLIPIVPRDPGLDPKKKTYIDYMTLHALAGISIDEVLAADEKAGRVFDWSQLR